MNKLIILKPRDAMELFQKYDVDNDVAMEIASYLYWGDEQFTVLSLTDLWDTCFHDKYHTYHLIEDWISISSENSITKQWL